MFFTCSQLLCALFSLKRVVVGTLPVLLWPRRVSCNDCIYIYIYVYIYIYIYMDHILLCTLYIYIYIYITYIHIYVSDTRNAVTDGAHFG